MSRGDALYQSYKNYTTVEKSPVSALVTKLASKKIALEGYIKHTDTQRDGHRNY